MRPSQWANSSLVYYSTFNRSYADENVGNIDSVGRCDDPGTPTNLTNSSLLRLATHQSLRQLISDSVFAIMGVLGPQPAQQSRIGEFTIDKEH